MSGLPRTRLRRPRQAFVVLVLLFTLGLAALLAYQAHMAARAHQATAEKALREYASFASWEFANRLKKEFYYDYTAALKPLARVEDKTAPDLPSPFVLAGSKHRDGAHAASLVRYYFRLCLCNKQLFTNGAVPEPGVLAWIRDTLAAQARLTYQADWEYASIFPTIDGQRHLLVYAVERNRHGHPTFIYGFGTHSEALQPIIAEVFRGSPLVPSSLTGGLANDLLLAVRVTDARGHELYRSAAPLSPAFSAMDTLVSKHSGMIIQASVRPEVVDRLVTGGVPRSRFPMLVALVAVTAALVVAALLQIKRENELARLRADFVSGVSHELRTPLAQIRMFTETLLLDRVRSGEERRRSIEIIDQEARRLAHLVENILHFSRAERQAARLAPESVELGGLIRETIEAFAPLATSRKVKVRTAFEQGQLVAAIDRYALQQILLNLLDNAVKYGPVGQTVTIGLASAGRGLRIWVDDEGPGIPYHERERIWEPFSRLEREQDSAVAGTGIGLAVVRELATLHGGRVWVESAPAPGARFVMELPTVGQRVPAPEASQPMHPEPTAASSAERYT